ncbi:hypothetical protein JNUCC0626_37530 [Lentzea sp. JNUCC 0626]|uniref:hypothetical protein n=1 Tax=Lentzea sp. JNUCC 0626 TaxID=3367513 RepID=UPI003748D8EF
MRTTVNAPQGWQQQGWQQQPQPGPGHPQQGQPHPNQGHPPQGHPQQGYPQGHQGYPPQPPKKGKGPLIAIAIVAAVLLLGGIGTGGFFFFNARKDQGLPQRSDAIPEKCASVSPETLAKARTTNPDGQRSSQPQANTTNCHWDQTEGKDSPGYRMLRVQIWDGAGKFEDMVRMVTSTGPAKEVSGINGFGDEAKGFVTERPGESVVEYALAARKGDHCVLIEYSGSDPGLFSLTKPDTAQLGDVAKSVMNDVLGKL